MVDTAVLFPGLTSVGVSDDPPSGPSVLVGIPAYNEASTIGAVVESARSYADEVLVVDDGSDDGTPDRAREAGATLWTHDRNQGYGATLATIFQYAHESGVEHLVILDADGQHDTSDVPDLISIQQETGAQIVTGSRYGERSSSEIPAYRRFGLGVINLLTNLGLRIGYSYPPISDSQCGFRAYDQEAIATMADASGIGSGMGASLDILFEAAREGYEVVEMPTKIDYDVDDASTRNPVVHGFDLLTSLFLSITSDRPARMASVVAIVALLGGASVLALGLFGGTAVYVLVPVLIAFVLVGVVTLSGRSPRSERIDR